ncbi:MAG TPA: SDR family oxidoreductase [Polyangia bacterium]|nr:SDR family oxidoreductase [Polyangia bacterium]
MLVAVTGATGHIGANLVRSLVARGLRPRVLVHQRSRAALEGLAVDEFAGDVADPQSLLRLFDGAEIVYHLAAKISLDDREKALMRATNVGGVRNVVAACLQQRVRRLVHFSSIHALSTLPKAQRVDETRPLVTNESVPPYDRSKADGEREIKEGLERGLDVVTVNPTGVTGPNDFGPSHMGELVLDLFRGKLPGIVDGGFNWVDVRDVAEAAISAGEKGRKGERYLLSGFRATIVEVCAILESIGGAKTPKIVSPMWLARGAAPFAVGWARLVKRRPLFTPTSLVALRNHQQISGERARVELGHTVRPLEDTVRDAFAWFGATGMLA